MSCVAYVARVLRRASSRLFFCESGERFAFFKRECDIPLLDENHSLVYLDPTESDQTVEQVDRDEIFQMLNVIDSTDDRTLAPELKEQLRVFLETKLLTLSRIQTYTSLNINPDQLAEDFHAEWETSVRGFEMANLLADFLKRVRGVKKVGMSQRSGLHGSDLPLLSYPPPSSSSSRTVKGEMRSGDSAKMKSRPTAPPFKKGVKRVVEEEGCGDNEVIVIEPQASSVIRDESREGQRASSSSSLQKDERQKQQINPPQQQQVHGEQIQRQMQCDQGEEFPQQEQQHQHQQQQVQEEEDKDSEEKRRQLLQQQELMHKLQQERKQRQQQRRQRQQQQQKQAIAETLSI